MDGFSRVEAGSSNHSEDAVTSGLVLIDGHHLYWEGHGPVEAPCIILMHHGLGSVRSWHHQIPALTQSGFKVIVYDRWGYGRSDIRPKFEDNFLLHDADEAIQLLDDLNIQRAHFIGHSDGGTIALYFALQNCHKVSSLVTVAAHIYLEADMEPGILEIKSSFKRDTRFREGMHRVHGEKFGATFNNWFNGWNRPEAEGWDMRSILSGINCPTLVVQGEEDEFASPQHAYDIHRNIPHSSLWLIPGVEHMVPQEIPTDFNTKVIEFFRTNREQGSI